MPLEVDPVSVHGVWYRHVPHRGRVWWRADPPASGRWQRGAVVAGLYLADSRDTAWAEWYRQLGELGLRPERQLPRDLWRLAVELDRVADLSDGERLSAVGLSLPRPMRREWPAFQAVGERLHVEGYRGVVAPSAARSDGRILCLFREGEKIEGVKPVPPPAIYRKLPPPPSNA